MYARNGYKCVCCGYHDESKTGKNLSAEHIEARSKGGEVQGRADEPSDNLTTLCMDCNRDKNNLPVAKFNARLAAVKPGAHYDVKAIRRINGAASKKPFTPEQIAHGNQLAKNVEAYRKLSGIVKSAEAEHEEAKLWHADPVHGFSSGGGTKVLPHAGPGVHRDEHGKFTSARLAVLLRARELTRLLRARLGG